jgi:hypothetical protein
MGASFTLVLRKAEKNIDFGKGYFGRYAYDGQNNPYAQKGSNVNGEDNGDGSGFSIDCSGTGNSVAVGAPGNGSEDETFGNLQGHVRVYRWKQNTSKFSQMKPDIDGSETCDSLGHSVTLSKDGHLIASGARTSNNNADCKKCYGGQALVFEWA